MRIVLKVEVLVLVLLVLWLGCMDGECNLLVVGLNCAEEECMLLIVVGKLRVLGTWQ